MSIPWGERVFNAMRDKTLNGLMVNVDSAYDLKIHEVAPHVLLSKDIWLGHLYILAMNRRAWDELAQEDKLAIGRATETAYRQLGRVMDESFDAMVGDLKKSGAKVRLLGAEELEAWKTTTRYQDVQAAWANDQQNKGVKDATTVLRQVSEILNSMPK